MGIAQAIVLRRQPFLPRYGNCPMFSPLWVGRKDKKLHRRTLCVSVGTVSSTVTDWHRVLKELRSEEITIPVLMPKLLPARRKTRMVTSFVKWSIYGDSCVHAA